MEISKVSLIIKKLRQEQRKLSMRYTITLDRRQQKELTRMGKKMDYGLTGMKTDRSDGKERLRMGKEMVYGLIGMRMERRVQK